MKICMLFVLSRLKSGSAQANNQNCANYNTHRKIAHRYDPGAASYILVLSIIPPVQTYN